MSTTDMSMLEMISPAYNKALDETLHKKILAARGTMIELEKKKSDKNPVPEGSKAVLETLLGLENDVCSFAAFMFYCEEVAHAFMLNDNPQKGLEYAASALTCAQILGQEAKQADLFGLLFKIAVFSNHFQMAMAFLDQQKEIRPLSDDMQEAYESMEELIKNDLAPKPKYDIEGGELPITEAVLTLLQRGPAEMAARFIRRAGGMPLSDARREADTLTEAQLATMFGA